MEQRDPLAGLPPVHPGAFLRDMILPELKEGKAELARMLKISRQSLYDLLDGSARVTPEMALRLGKLLGNGGEFWINLQAQYDLKVARVVMADELASIPTIERSAAA